MQTFRRQVIELQSWDDDENPGEDLWSFIAQHRSSGRVEVSLQIEASALDEVPALMQRAANAFRTELQR
jgi:hypothetical protein